MKKLYLQYEDNKKHNKPNTNNQYYWITTTIYKWW